jgi:pimeloyl-ACP methyl ester carboxylesterase
MPSKRTYFNVLKGLSILIILLLPRIFIEFRISDEEALEEFTEDSLKPSFGVLETDARRLHYAYLDQGNDLLIVFVHGSPGSWNAFIDFFMADSVLKNTDILSIDRPGFGQSDFGNAEPSLKVQAELLNNVIELFDHKRKILIGHSLGAPTIARIAMDNPSSFDGLIFVAPSIDPELEKQEWYQMVIKSNVGKLFTPTEFTVSNNEILALKKELELMVPLWEKIRIPIVLIHGTEDSLVPKENADFARRMLPDSLLSIRMLKGENHFIPWSNPWVIIEAIYQIDSYSIIHNP